MRYYYLGISEKSNSRERREGSVPGRVIGSQPGTSAGLSLADFSAAFVKADHTCFLSLFTQLHRQPLLVFCLLLWQALLVLWDSCFWPRKASCVCFPLCTCLRSVSSIAQLCPILCDPMNHRTPGLPVHH